MRQSFMLCGVEMKGMGIQMQQLKMMWKKQPIENYHLAEDFLIRTYKKGDTQGWIDVCADTLGTANMSEEDFKKTMLEKDGICAESIFFIVNKQNEIVGTATGILNTNPDWGHLHMVSIDPKYRGLKLAKPLNAAVLNYFDQKQRDIATLYTDDVRLPAIKVYLSLGFRPILCADDMYERWQNIIKQLDIMSVDTYEEDGSNGKIVTI